MDSGDAFRLSSASSAVHHYSTESTIGGPSMSRIRGLQHKAHHHRSNEMLRPRSRSRSPDSASPQNGASRRSAQSLFLDGMRPQHMRNHPKSSSERSDSVSSWSG